MKQAYIFSRSRKYQNASQLAAVEIITLSKESACYFSEKICLFKAMTKKKFSCKRKCLPDCIKYICKQLLEKPLLCLFLISLEGNSDEGLSKENVLHRRSSLIIYFCIYMSRKRLYSQVSFNLSLIDLIRKGRLTL